MLPYDDLIRNQEKMAASPSQFYLAAIESNATYFQ